MPRRPSLTSQLCSAAANGRNLNPTACQNCESPCEYGKEWLRHLGLEQPKEAHDPIFFSSDAPELKTTFKDIYRRRDKSFRAQRI